MKIIKRGEIPNIAKRFTCKYCGTVFEAENGEYKGASQMAYMMDGIEYEATCPICNRTAYIRRGK